MIRRLLPLFVAAALAGCAGQMPKMDGQLLEAPGTREPIHAKLAQGKFEASIMAIGSERDLAQERGRHMGFVHNAPLAAWLDGIRNKLLASSGVTDVPGKVQIVANTSYSARATADGNIMISMAWLPDVESEDEIAAIIAHELSHVLLKHQSTNIIGLAQKRFQAAHEMLVGGRMVANKATQIGQTDSRALLAAQLSVELVDKLVMPAWNRRQETEADLLGVDLLIKAGYSPDGMTQMLERLRSWESSSRESEEALQKRLKELAAKNPGLALQAGINSWLQEASREHPETDKRLDAVAEYQDRHYGELSPPPLAVASLKKLRAGREVGAVLKNYQHAIRAKKRLGEGNVLAAYNEAQLGVQGPTARDPMPNWILWQAAKAAGRARQHAKALDIALHAPEPIVEVYREAIAINEQSGKYQVALDLVNEAGKAFGDAPEWAPDRIRLLKKAGKKNEAQALALKCAVDTPQLRKACYEAGKS